MTAYIVRHDDGTVAAILFPDDQKNRCRGQSGGEYGDLCGGCDACQLQQAQHAGMHIEEHDDEMKAAYFDRGTGEANAQ